MARRLGLVVLIVGGAVGAWAAEPVPPAGATCLELVAADNHADALDHCRAASEAADAPLAVLRAAGEAEYEAGKPEKSVALWRRAVAAGEWNRDDRRSLAMALWRNKELDEAEGLLREILERQPDLVGFRDLMTFLVDFSRMDEVIPLADEAIERFPFACSLYEDRGTARDFKGDFVGAAADFVLAVDKGCPGFRWTKLGNVHNNIENPAYRPLLTPSRLIIGLDDLDDLAARERLELLRLTMSPEAAPAVTRVVLNRRKAEVRFAGLGLLVQLGAEAMPFWKELAEAGDFILEKHCLRRWREIGDPAFIPLLEARLEADQTPSNRATTKLILGEMLFDTGERERGEAMMLSIAEDSNLLPVAMESLATRVEGEDPARAIELIERAQALEPRLYINPGRMEKLRKAAGMGE